MKGYGKRERQRHKIILERKKVTINKQKNKMLKEATHEEMKKEKKRPLGLDIVLFFSAIFGFGMLMIGFTVFSFSLYYSSQYPILFIAQLALSLAGFLLILSVVGLWLQKKIAYWSMMFAWVVIMFSGLYTNYVIEIKTEGFIPAGLGGFIPDFLFYGVIPIAIVFYLLAEKSKTENWIEIKNLYQLERLVGIISGLVVFLGIIFLLNYFVLTMIMDPFTWLATIIAFIVWLIAVFISFIVYNIVAHGLIRKKDVS